MGHRCLYLEHEPRTDAGWQVWDVVVHCSGQLRLAGSAVIGLDMAGVLALGAELGYDAAALAELLPAAEAGLVAAINTRLAEDA